MFLSRSTAVSFTTSSFISLLHVYKSPLEVSLLHPSLTAATIKARSQNKRNDGVLFGFIIFY